MQLQTAAHSYAFSPRLKQQILDLHKHREPSYPSFLTLELTTDDGEAGWATVWYVGRTGESDGRYHVQFAGENKVLPAKLYNDQPIIEVVTGQQ